MVTELDWVNMFSLADLLNPTFWFNKSFAVMVILKFSAFINFFVIDEFIIVRSNLSLNDCVCAALSYRTSEPISIFPGKNILTLPLPLNPHPLLFVLAEVKIVEWYRPDRNMHKTHTSSLCFCLCLNLYHKKLFLFLLTALLM